MSNKKISELTEATPLATDDLPFVDNTNHATKRTTRAHLFSLGFVLGLGEAVSFNQSSEHIKSANSGYLDLGAQTKIRLNQHILISAKNIETDTTTGMKIGTSSSQKLGFFGETPIIKPTQSHNAASMAGGGGTAIYSNHTFDGYTIAKVVRCLVDLGILDSNA